MIKMFLYNGTFENISLVNTTSFLNTTSHVRDYDSYIYRELYVIIIIVLMYSIIFLLAICGNIMVIIIVFSNRHMHTPINYFIVNLAFADLLLTIFCMPNSCIASFVYGWHMGAVMCKLISFFQGVSVVASVNTLAAIAFDRYLAICQFFDFIMTRKMARTLIAALWIWAFIMFFPWLYNFKEVVSEITVKGEQLMICVPAWESPLLDKLHLIGIVYLFCYVIPLLAISVFYSLIVKKVWFRPVFDGVNDSSNKIIQRSKMKVLKMLLLEVFLFALSWLPLLTLYVYLKLNDDDVYVQEKIGKAMPFLQFIGQANSCINPIIYCFYSSKFRKGFNMIVCFGVSMKPQHSLSLSRRSVHSTRRRHIELKKKQPSENYIVDTPNHNEDFNTIVVDNHKDSPPLLCFKSKIPLHFNSKSRKTFYSNSLKNKTCDLHNEEKSNDLKSKHHGHTKEAFEMETI